jgi:hypothetical protein
MKKWNLQCFALVGFAAVAGAAQAGTIRVYGDVTGGAIPGETAGTRFRQGNGGEFKVEIVSGTNWPANEFSDNIGAGGANGNDTFQTFCLEKDEFLSLGGTYTTNDSFTQTAVLGGNNTNSGDTISKQTAWLYLNFRNGTLSGYDYDAPSGSTTRASDAEQLQIAIWALENEENTGIGAESGLAAVLGILADGSAAETWVTAALSAPAAALNAAFARVGVLNLSTGAENNQSVLTLMPLPSATGLAMAGLMGMTVRRRRSM